MLCVRALGICRPLNATPFLSLSAAPTLEGELRI